MSIATILFDLKQACLSKYNNDTFDAPAKTVNLGETGGTTAITGAATVSDTLAVTGASTLTGAVTIAAALVRTGGDLTPPVSVPDGAAYTVLAANSGKIHLILNQGQDATLTLPTAAAGLYYEFWSTMINADGHDWFIDTGSDTNFYLGGLMWTVAAGDGTTVAGDGDSNSIMHVVLPDASTLIKMSCDGTNWFLTGHVFSATTPTFADQS